MKKSKDQKLENIKFINILYIKPKQTFLKSDLLKITVVGINKSQKDVMIDNKILNLKLSPSIEYFTTKNKQYTNYKTKRFDSDQVSNPFFILGQYKVV